MITPGKLSINRISVPVIGQLSNVACWLSQGGCGHLMIGGMFDMTHYLLPQDEVFAVRFRC